MCLPSGHSALSTTMKSIHQSRDYLKLSCVSFNLRCLPRPTIDFLASPLSHWGHKRPPGSKRAPASRKAWCPPQAATKQRTKIQKSSDAFHGSALYRHWFKIHTASPGPTFSCRPGYSLTCMAPCKGRQRKFIISGMIFVHSPVVQLQTDDKNFDRSLMVTMVSFGFLFVMSEPQLPVPRPQPHGLSHAKLLSTRH